MAFCRHTDAAVSTEEREEAEDGDQVPLHIFGPPRAGRGLLKANMPSMLAHTPWMPAPARYGAVMWLSFLLAAVATGVFFSAIDPDELRLCVNLPPLSRSGAYTVGFFLFWLFGSLSGVLAVAFTYPVAPVSECSTETAHPDE